MKQAAIFVLHVYIVIGNIFCFKDYNATTTIEIHPLLKFIVDFVIYIDR